MKKVIITIISIVVILCAVLIVLNWNAIQLWCALNSYNRMLDSELPEDLTLTIYYIPVGHTTRYALSVEQLIEYSGATKIVVEADELSKQLSSLKLLNSATLIPCEEDVEEKFDELTDYGFRFYFVFETGDSEKLFDVAIRRFVGRGEAYFVAYVNGIAVESDYVTYVKAVNRIKIESNSVFYEMILPFLSERDQKALDPTNLFLRNRNNSTTETS